MIFEWDDVKQRIDNARMVRAWMILGEKHSENKLLRKYKARLVAGSNRLFDVYGNLVTGKVAHQLPASLEELRVLLIYANACEEGESLVGDIDGAYLIAKLRADPTFLALTEEMKEMFPEAKKFRCPVVRLVNALYGLERAGADWHYHAEQVFTKLGYVKVGKCGAGTIYKKGQVMTLLYVDDFGIGGPRKDSRAIWDG